MTVQELMDYCNGKPGATIDFPFGDEPICYKLNKKLFAQIYPRQENYKITLKCDPDLALALRAQYPEVVVRGYHCPPLLQPYWNTVWLHSMEEELVLRMIDHSYEQVMKSFSKKQQAILKKELEIVNRTEPN